MSDGDNKCGCNSIYFKFLIIIKCLKIENKNHNNYDFRFFQLLRVECADIIIKKTLVLEI